MEELSNFAIVAGNKAAAVFADNTAVAAVAWPTAAASWDISGAHNVSS